MKRIFIAWVSILSLLSGCATPSKMAVDSQVQELCAKDGGIKVYETVILPPERFNGVGQINFYRPTQKENALGDEYIYQRKSKRYIDGSPTSHPNQIAMERREVQVIRKRDMKVLGESVWYERAGGDSPGPWMPSSFVCPEISTTGEVALFSKIFVEGKNK